MNIFWSLSPRQIIADYSEIRRLVMGDCSNDGVAPLGLDQVQSPEKRYNFCAEDPKDRRIAPVPDQGNHRETDGAVMVAPPFHNARAISAKHPV